MKRWPLNDVEALETIKMIKPEFHATTIAFWQAKGTITFETAKFLTKNLKF